MDYNLLKELRADPLFEYDVELQEEISLWDSFWDWVSSLFPDEMKFVKMSIGTIISYGVIAVAIILVLLQVSGIRVQSLLKKDEMVSENKLTFEEDIHSVKMEDLIADYEKEEKFHEALRYNYLNLLKWLDTKKFIEWKIDKTNYHYLTELKKNKSSFKSIIHLVEYVCYGELKISEGEYKKELERYNQFKQEIQ